MSQYAFGHALRIRPSTNIRYRFQNFFDHGTLQINNMERFKSLPAKYFRLYHPLLYHTKCPNNFVYCYSLSLKPEEYQPSGLCNFSNYKNIYLQFKIKSYKQKSDYIIKAYAINYNLLIFKNGTAGLAFSC